MAFLFLDIETFIDPEDDKSGLNPYKKKSKVLTISYKFYAGLKLKVINKDKPDERLDLNPLTTYKEWESDEKTILEDFWEFFKGKVEEEVRTLSGGQVITDLKVVGFNQTKFDLPYLFGRMMYHKIATEDELYSVLFERPNQVDLMQLAMTINSTNFKKKDGKWQRKTQMNHEFFNQGQKEINKTLGIKVKKGSGMDITKYYLNEEYEKIEEYIKDEFTFEELYFKIKKCVFPKEGPKPNLLLMYEEKMKKNATD
tara:strand:+ start:802 stop:1566 length:765 start_codon:yes stop_codon:yes gene_type:complete